MILITCPTCSGEGTIVVDLSPGNSMAGDKTCPECGGTGKIEEAIFDEFNALRYDDYEPWMDR